MYYPCSENKDADQLRGYREADLRLCFRICRLLVFPRDGSFIQVGSDRARKLVRYAFTFRIAIKQTQDRSLTSRIRTHCFVSFVQVSCKRNVDLVLVICLSSGSALDLCQSTK